MIEMNNIIAVIKHPIVIIGTVFSVIVLAVALPEKNQANNHETRPYTVHMKDGYRSSSFQCDSLQMISSKMVDTWRDGQRMRIYSREPILIEANK